MKLPFLVLFLLTPALLHAGGDSAPSSHMVFHDGVEGDIMINEVRVPADGEALYTYYEAMGWSGKAGGYCGIQAHPKAHNYLFSIWDHKDHTAPIREVFVGAGTTTEKFGGEGTGLKSWNFELGWDVDVWYTLVARAWEVGDHTFCGYWVRSGETEEWDHLVTMDVAAPRAYFRGGTDAFLEDWLSTGTEKRITNLRGTWRRDLEGAWHPATKARYSVNSWDLVEGKRSFNFRTNWDGGIAEDETGPFYYMIAGGEDTEPTAENPSEHSIPREETEPAYAPLVIAGASAKLNADGEVEVSWENDPQSLPQFSFAVELITGEDNADAAPLATLADQVPHARSATVEVPEDAATGPLRVRIRAWDILDHPAEALEVAVEN